eukprot:10667-Heterococcus_DN1.PRE.1
MHDAADYTVCGSQASVSSMRCEVCAAGVVFSSGLWCIGMHVLLPWHYSGNRILKHHCSLQSLLQVTIAACNTSSGASPTAAEAATAVGDISSSSSNSTAAATAAAVLVPYTPLLTYAKSVLALSSEHIAAYSSSDQTAGMQREPLLSAVLPSLTAAL